MLTQNSIHYEDRFGLLPDSNLYSSRFTDSYNKLRLTESASFELEVKIKKLLDKPVFPCSLHEFKINSEAFISESQESWVGVFFNTHSHTHFSI